MRIVIVHDRGAMRRWHLWFAKALANSKLHDVSFFGVAAKSDYPKALDVLRRVERFVYRRGRDGASDPVSDDQADGLRQDYLSQLGENDLIIDLSSSYQSKDTKARVLLPLYNRAAGELAAIDAWLSGLPISLELSDSAQPFILSLGHVATDHNQLFLSLDNAFCSVARVLSDAIASGPEFYRTAGERSQLRSKTSVRMRTAASSLRVGIGIGTKVAARLSRLGRRGDNWAVAWRRTDGDAICELDQVRGFGYERVANNEGTFFADPFVLYRDGRHYVFVEEFVFSDNKAVISVFTIEADGSVSPSRVILDRPYHLSYPFVFEHEGDVWMIPESYSGRNVELFRADVFPFKWSLHTRLLDDVMGYDSTIVRHDDQFWMFMASSTWQGGSPFSWDKLAIYQADKIDGPWQQMPIPLQLDAYCARPAGHMYRRNNCLWRPTQDCSEVYGGALTLCRVNQLDQNGFRQTPVSTLFVRPGETASRLHTLNHDHGLEIIDFFGSHSKSLLHIEARQFERPPSGVEA